MKWQGSFAPYKQKLKNKNFPVSQRLFVKVVLSNSSPASFDKLSKVVFFVLLLYSFSIKFLYLTIFRGMFFFWFVKPLDTSQSVIQALKRHLAQVMIQCCVHIMDNKDMIQDLRDSTDPSVDAFTVNSSSLIRNGFS